MNVTIRIFELMASRNMTPAQPVKKIPLSNGVITQWKQGKQKPSLSAVSMIADYFGVTTDCLLCRTDNPYPPEPGKPFVEERVLLERLNNLPPEKRKAFANLLELFSH